MPTKTGPEGQPLSVVAKSRGGTLVKIANMTAYPTEDTPVVDSARLEALARLISEATNPERITTFKQSKR